MRNLSCQCRIAGFFLILVFFSCKKDVTTTGEDSTGSGNQTLLSAINIDARIAALSSPGNDATETQTILGVRLPNPYTIVNMKQAYTNITGQTSTPSVTNLFVRFKPSNLDQLKVLDSTMEARNLDLFDTPLDFQVVQEGDYYQDPSIPLEQITWLYAVVTPSFVFPPGIPYETLASIHIPTNTAVEQEAERLAGLNADGDGLAGTTVAANGSGQGFQTMDAGDCPPGQVWDAIARKCVPQGGTGPVDPVSVPAGRIMVFDTQLDVAGAATAQPVRTLRVVAKRWFKIDRSFTDANGNFRVTKNFRRKVKLIVKFKNQFSVIRSIRGARLWQMLLPIEKQIGVYTASTVNNVSHIFQTSTDPSSKTMRNWAAATTLNGVQEHRDYSTALGFSAAPTGLNIYVTNYNSAGSTPLFFKRQIQTVPIPFINTMMVNNNAVIAGGTAALATVLSRANADMTIGYKVNGITSDALKETVYHEMSHASHYTRAGAALYANFVNAELNEIMLTAAGSGNSPYGSGTDSNSPIIALGEGWAYFMGHFLTDRRYTTFCSKVAGQGITYSNNTPVNGLSSHLNLLEDFDPINRRLADPFWWIPQGLMYDLIDNRNDINGSPQRVLLNDIVTEYTIQQLSNALQGDISRWQDYRVRLLTQNNNNQATGVNTIFQFYGY